jgi:hypothetical protein
MEGYCSTGQNLQRAVVPMEEEYNIPEILGFHSGIDEDLNLLGCGAVVVGREVPEVSKDFNSLIFRINQCQESYPTA